MYVHQAKDNSYWFGSNDRGVYHYDGRQLVNFTSKDGLVSDRIRGIQEDKNGNIYFTTYEGISKYDGSTFTTLTAIDAPTPAGWRKHPDDLWFIGPGDQGVVLRYDGQTLHRLRFPPTELGEAHFKKMPRSEYPHAVYNPYDLYCIVRDSRGDIWFGGTCVGVCRYNGSTFEWLTDPVLTEAPVRSILEDRSGNIWVTYSGHGSIEKPRPIADFHKVHLDTKGSIIEGMCIVQDEEGNLWTAALGAGVFKWVGDGSTRYPILEGETPIEVFAVYKDNAGALWLGTHNGGAYKFNGTSFERFQP